MKHRQKRFSKQLLAFRGFNTYMNYRKELKHEKTPQILLGRQELTDKVIKTLKIEMMMTVISI